MQRPSRDKIITVAASAYFQPILDLSAQLLKWSPSRVTAGRIGYYENAYALAIVLLLVVSLESYVGRVSYLQSQRAGGRPKPPRTSVPAYLKTLRKSFRLERSLTEVFVLRDVIAHAHVWELEVSHHAVHGQVLRKAEMLGGYGDQKHRAVLNPRTRRSSIHGLNLVPAAVGRREVCKVLDLTWRTLQFLVKAKLLEAATLNFHGRFQGKPFDFWDLRDALCAP